MDLATNMTTELLARGRYRVEGPIGQGAMGAVLLARDTVLGRVVAVKVLAGHLAGNDALRRRFLQEARLAARLCHPNVVQVFDAGEEDGRPFLVMEYVDGETVADRLARHQRLRPDEIVALGRQVAAALAHAHAHGIVHRDVKPHNVIVRGDGVAKLTDFGIARAMEDSGLTEIGAVLGTAPFMAPEQAAGRAVGPPADVYALGALVRHLSAGPLPAAVAGLVEAALAEDPAARPTAAEFQARLGDDAPTVVDPAGPVAGPAAGSAAAEAGRAGAAAEFAPTQVRRAGGTEVLPGPANDAPPRRHRWSGMAIAVAAVALLVFALALSLTGSGGGHAATVPAPTATSAPPATTATTAPAPPSPSQAARDLSAWLRGHAR
jgi:serine/threonine-protein kinase